MLYEDVKFDKHSKFLVTGGAGFIGSSIIEKLVQENYYVRCLDDLSNGFIENIQPFLNKENFEFIKGDVSDLDTCLKATEGMDYVMHKAAWGSVPRSIEMPLYYELVNIRGTLNIFEASRVNHVKKVVYASSSSVYGDSVELPKKEDKVGNVLSPYALTKKTNEEYGRLYSQLYNLDTYGLRYFNVFGPRQNPNGQYAAVIPKFINQLSNNEAPTINGDGKQSRDFTYIENVVYANLKACLADTEAAGKAYNIASGGRIYLIDLYNMLCELLDVKTVPNFTDTRAGDIKHSNADISLAKKYLGYNVKVEFKDGLKELVQYYDRMQARN